MVKKKTMEFDLNEYCDLLGKELLDVGKATRAIGGHLWKTQGRVIALEKNYKLFLKHTDRILALEKLFKKLEEALTMHLTEHIIFGIRKKEDVKKKPKPIKSIKSQINANI